MNGPVEIVPRVHGLGSELVNWYLVEEEGRLTAVDAGVPGFARTLEDDLRTLGHGVQDVEAVVLTHSDLDHTGVVPAFQAAGARVLIHPADQETLRRPRTKTGDAKPVNLARYAGRAQMWRTFAHLARGGAARPPKVEGAATFADDDVLDVPGRPRVVHTPGHTPGHCALLFEGHGALFVGDAMSTWNTLTGRRGPQVTPSGFNVSTDQAFESLAAIERLDAEVMLFGHGEPWRGGVAEAVAGARAAGRT